MSSGPMVSPETLMLRSHERVILLARDEGWLPQALCGAQHPIWADRRCLLLAGHDGCYHKTGVSDPIAWQDDHGP